MSKADKPVAYFRELDIVKIEKMSRKELNAETAHCWREQVDLCAKIEFLTKRNQELVSVIKSLLNRWERVGADKSTSYQILSKAISSIDREK